MATLEIAMATLEMMPKAVLKTEILEAIRLLG
jgi:hypothetical protein